MSMTAEEYQKLNQRIRQHGAVKKFDKTAVKKQAEFVFVYDLPIVPYVRMTRRGKFVKGNAQRYIASQQSLSLLMRSEFNKQGRSISDKPFRVKAQFEIAKRFTVKDLDNIGKAVCDSAQGIVYHNDRQVVEIYYRKFQGKTKRDCAVIVFTEEKVR